jgi:hypothetical protein
LSQTRPSGLTRQFIDRKDDVHLLNVELLVRGIRDCLADATGDTSARVIDSFVPGSLAVYNPAAYEKSIAAIFPDGWIPIITAIERSVCQIAQLENRDWPSLFDCMKAVSLSMCGGRRNYLPIT